MKYCQFPDWEEVCQPASWYNIANSQYHLKSYIFISVTIWLLVCGDNYSILLLYLHQTTPLHVAAAKDNLDAVKYLVDSGADFKIKQQYGVSEWVYWLYRFVTDALMLLWEHTPASSRYGKGEGVHVTFPTPTPDGNSLKY